MTHNDIRRYMRQCESYLAMYHEFLEGTVDQVAVTTMVYRQDVEYRTERDKWCAWAAASMHRTLADILAGENLYAYRGVLQVHEYYGRAGFLPSILADIRTALRNWGETFFRGDRS